MTELYCPLKKGNCSRNVITHKWVGYRGYGYDDTTSNPGMCASVHEVGPGSRSPFSLEPCSFAVTALRQFIPRNVSSLVDFRTENYNTLILLVNGKEANRVTRGNLNIPFVPRPTLATVTVSTTVNVGLSQEKVKKVKDKHNKHKK